MQISLGVGCYSRYHKVTMAVLMTSEIVKILTAALSLLDQPRNPRRLKINSKSTNFTQKRRFAATHV